MLNYVSLVVTLIPAIAGTYWYNTDSESKTVSMPIPHNTYRVPEIKIINKVTNLDLVPVKDTGLANVSSSYLGFSGVIPDSKVVDWNVSAKKLWDRKLQIKDVTEATQSSAKTIVSNYKYSSVVSLSLKEHIKEVKDDLKRVKGDVRWFEICDYYSMDKKYCDTFIKTSQSIDAEMMTAYSMTELMPYRDGKKNFVLMELYMQEGGRNYLDIIPALGDKYLSMGRYQFTSFAIGHDSTGLRPANKIASYSTTYSIPGSVTKLRGIKSDRAAYYFATYNIMLLIRNLSPGQLKKYNKHCSNDKDGLLQYIATAHHNPKWARKRATAWIDGKCNQDLIKYQGPKLEVYSIKTKTNFKAVKKYT